MGRSPGDDESRMFLSEASVSEGGDSSGHVQARHRYGPPPPPAHQPPSAQPSPVPTSPGNTSLSSWDSPAIKNRVLLQFTPEKQPRVHLARGPNGAAVSVLPNTSRHSHDGEADSSYGNSRQVNQPPPLPSMSTSDYQEQRSTDEVSHNSKVSPFDGHRLHAIGSFIDKMRHRSTGGLQNRSPPSPAYPVERGADSYQIRTGASTGRAQNTTAAVFNSERTGDISLAMTLSDSENEGDQNMALYGMAHADEGNDEDDDDADWEEEISADNHITAKRLARIKVQSSNNAHRRTRSGDAAAASLATGGKHYRIQIPVEDCDDDEDDDGDNNRGLRTMQGRRRDRVHQSRDNANRPAGGSSFMNVLPATSRQNSPGSLASVQEERDKGENIGSGVTLTTPDQVDVSSSDPPIYSQSSGETPAFNPKFSSPGYYSDEEGESDIDSTDGARRDSVQNNRLQFPPDRHDLNAFEQLLEDRKFRGSAQNVLRTHAAARDSPFQNIGKNSTEKANRSTFLPKSSVIEDDPQSCATYVCPNCRTIQREFFTVADAPRQLDSASGYIALYFGTYVVASLFIFGLEEGWEPLDCIYFAVVTLTTAGLGDFVPTTDANKIICSIFIYFGVACIGLLLGSYIAGMLDDKAYREAKAKQINSCPNCARLQTIRESAKVGSRASFSRAFPTQGTKMKRHMSERISDNAQVQDHAAKYVSGHHHKRRQSGSSSPRRSPDDHSDRRNQSGQFELTPSDPASKHHRDGSNGVESNGLPSPYSSQQQPSPNFLGSPMTRQILGRQSHTRHGSMDITGNAFFAAGVTSTGSKTYGAVRPRGFSADMSSAQPPPINENRPLEGSSAMPAIPFESGGYNGVENNCEDDGYSSDDDESVVSTSSSSSTEVLLDERATKLRSAKYVFLTLRQALVNSMVIIAVGCIGFWLIEGFSLVDSWYFTTVFLTTVGYGMYSNHRCCMMRPSGSKFVNMLCILLTLLTFLLPNISFTLLTTVSYLQVILSL
jgi:hypothetical protein